MNNKIISIYNKKLSEITSLSQNRQLISTKRQNNSIVIRNNKTLISFSCNDYLGLSQNAQVLEASIKAIKKYGDKWWVGLEKDDPKLFDKLSFYDQLTNTVGRGFVCAKCLDKDSINWNKYRKNETTT